MIDLKALAGDIMGYYQSFRGSKAAFNTDSLLIVRGKSTLRDSYTTMPEKLNGVMELFEGEEIPLDSVKAQEFLVQADKIEVLSYRQNLFYQIKNILNIKDYRWL